jgi:hypothetical protein
MRASHQPILTLFFAACLATRAQAAPKETVGLAIAGDETCPSSEAVEDALARLAPQIALSPPGAPSQVSIRVEDVGASYEVRVGTVVRSMDDPDRRCEERARTTALIAAMILDPPRLGDAESPASPAAAPAAPRPLPPASSYPWALFDRPLAAPRGVALVREEVTMGVIGDSPWLEGAAEVLGFELGVGRGVQIGTQVAFPLTRFPGQGTVLTSVQVDISRHAAFRLETGFERATAPSSGLLIDANGGFVSLAFPARWRIARALAITGGGGSGLRSGWLVNYGPAYSSFSPFLSEGLFAIRGSLYASPGILFSLFLPVGLLFQPHRAIALHLQTGVRATFAEIYPTAICVPIDLDVVVTPHPRIDLGASLDVAGQTTRRALDYVTLMSFGAFLRVRI